MNAFAVYVVNEHMTQLRLEAAQRRATQASGTSTRQRIAAAATRVRLAFTTPASTDDPGLPTLDGYPYRG